MNEGRAIYTQTVMLPEGDLILQGPVPSELLRSLELDSGLRAFRPPQRQKEALAGISELDSGRIIAAYRDHTLYGYVTFHPADTFERWAHGPDQVLELGAIEIAPAVRRYGVARRLLEVSFSDPVMENFLVVATEYYWHWDLEGSGLQVWEYREVMRKIMAHVGMVVKDTDEEEISSHPANMLMVRYGSLVPREAVLEFEKMLFRKPDSNRG